MMLTHGFEFEVWSRAEDVRERLYEQGLTACDELHGYHCDCDDCRVLPWTDEGEYRPYDLHAQTDSSCGGEFISRVLDSFEDTARIAAALTAAVRGGRAEINSHCGLHVHVDAYQRSSVGQRRARSDRFVAKVPLAYLAVERYLCELIAPGSASGKREMNLTLLQRLRWWIGGDMLTMREMCEDDDERRVELLRNSIAADRHTDLNYSSRNGTWEFRVFNSTAHAWRIELAVRLSVAMVEHADELATTLKLDGNEWYSILSGSRHSTMRPRITFGEFVEIVAREDPALDKLIRRQSLYMRAKYRKTLADLEAADEESRALPSPEPPARPAPIDTGSTTLWLSTSTDALISRRNRLRDLLNEPISAGPF